MRTVPFLQFKKRKFKERINSEKFVLAKTIEECTKDRNKRLVFYSGLLLIHSKKCKSEKFLLTCGFFNLYFFKFKIICYLKGHCRLNERCYVDSVFNFFSVTEVSFKLIWSFGNYFGKFWLFWQCCSHYIVSLHSLIAELISRAPMLYLLRIE